MTTRSILQVFINYQKARTSFVQTVAELAGKPQNVEIMQQANVLELLRPLFTDICPQIRQCAVVALSRLTDADHKVAKAILSENILNELLGKLEVQNKYYKKSVLLVLRSLCKYEPSCAHAVIACGGLNAIIYCMGDFEQSVKEAALGAVGNIVKQSEDLAKDVSDSGAIPSITLCLQEPEVNMKQVAACVLSDIAKHSQSLAQDVVDSGALPHLAKSLNNTDPKLKRVLFNAFSNIAKHSVDLAECVVEANTFPTTLIHLAHACPRVRKQAMCLVRDVSKHSLALTEMVVNLGGIGAIIECASQDPNGEILLPSYVALGYIGGQNDQIALSIISCNGIPLLTETILTSKDDTLLSVTAWCLGQIGKHSPEHSKAIAVTGIFRNLLHLYMSQESSTDLQDKCKACLKQCLQKCMIISALEPLVYDAPSTILKYVLGQFSKLLPSDPKARRMFVTSGCLKKLQEIDAEPGSTLMEYITIINACFPDEIVRYYSPGYSDTLLEQVENYTPEMMSILREGKRSVSEAQTDNGIVADDTTSSPSRDLQNMIY